MNDLALYEDETEQKQHFSAIQKLVRDVSSSEEEIRRLGLTDYVETLTVDCYIIVISVLNFD
jgi:hypothetical protein